MLGGMLVKCRKSGWKYCIPKVGPDAHVGYSGEGDTPAVDREAFEEDEAFADGDVFADGLEEADKLLGEREEFL